MSELYKYLSVLFLAATPVIELRGAIPAGVAMGLSSYSVYLLSVIGSSLPAPFLILFFRKILHVLEDKGLFTKFTDFLHKHIHKKSKKIKSATILGLFLFIAIPLPTTGAYTGSALASIFNIRLKYAFPTIILGNMTAGLIMMTISHLIL